MLGCDKGNIYKMINYWLFPNIIFVMHFGFVKITMLNIFVVLVDNSKNCVRECKDALNYWTCIMKCNEPKSRTAIGSDGKYKHFKVPLIKSES